MKKVSSIFEISNKTYDFLKFFTTTILPAIGTLYFALAQIWGFPYAEQIVGTITAIDTFLGAILMISSASYNKAKTDTEKEISNIVN